MSVLEETLWYLGASLAVGALLLGVIFVVGSPIAFWVGVWPALEVFRRLALFAGLVVLLGVPCNLIFVVALRDRYYVAADPIVDWIPWLPSGNWILDEACGGHYLAGASVVTLRVAWALLAVPTWISAFLVLRSIA
jgi:hypothetical protein